MQLNISRQAANYLKYLLPFLICIFGDISFYTFWRNDLGPHISPVIFTLFGIGVGITFFRILFAGYKSKFQYNRKIPSVTGKPQRYTYAYLILIPLLAYWYFELSGVFQRLPIDFDTDPFKTRSDVIPNVMSYVKKTVNGEFPYQPIRGKEWTYELMPTYLTMTWLPYIPAELLHADYRWVPVIALTICILVYYRQSIPLKSNPLFFWLAFIAPILFLYLQTRFNIDDFKLTVEGLVTAYYLLLAFALGKKKYTWIVLMVLLCLLSRFSLLFWLPLLVLVVWQEYSIRYVYKGILAIAAGMVLLYGIFMIKDPNIFINAVRYYSSATVGEWTIADWLKEQGGQHPFSLSRGTGWAIWFYDYLDGTLEEKIAILKKVQLIIVSATTLVLCWHYWRHRMHTNGWLYALGGLKISLVVFYAFIQIPYAYLYILPVFLNLPMLIYGLKILNGEPQPAPMTKPNHQ